MKWYITTNGYARTHRKNAGSKAPSDIAEICRRSGMRPLLFQPFPRDAKSEVYMKLWLLTIGIFPWLQVFLSVQKGDVVFFQHPLYGNRFINQLIPFIRKKKECRFIVIIHDLESLRRRIGSNYTKEKERTDQLADNQLLRQFDAVICHNAVMKKYLVSQRFCPDKIICLELFDYLTAVKTKKKKRSDIPSIAIAGNLNPKKSGYIYKLKYPKDTLTVHLYGIEYDASQAWSGLNYHGSFEPEELPRYLQGDFGLVWDGISVETCSGNTGEYLRYNNPHKISLYLASNMPVIVWKESALADFVITENLGFAVDSLDEIPERIKSLSSSEYQGMCDAVQKEGEKLRNGYYTEKAINQALQIIGNGS